MHVLLSLKYPKECSLMAQTCLLKHDAQERHHDLGASTVITIVYEPEASEYHLHTCKHLILSLNHLNARTSITPQLMYLHQHMEPEYYHPTFMRHQHVAPECYRPTLTRLLNHLNEEFLIHKHPAIYCQ